MILRARRSAGRSAGGAILLPLLYAAVLASCAPRDVGGGDAGEPVAPAASGTTSEPAAIAAPMAKARVFFFQPQEGDTVKTLFVARFGAENFTIEPVGDGEVRAGAGHYHIGIDTDCLPSGEVIPQANPWIHLGDGSSVIEMQLAPGEHRLCLQIGDGEHRTLAGDGMSELITITVMGEKEEPSSRVPEA